LVETLETLETIAVMGISVRKVGVTLSPPCLVLLYSEGGAARRRAMPLRDLRPDTDCRALAAGLRRRHPRHLEAVPEVRVERMAMVAREHLRGHSLAEALRRVEQQLAVDPAEDLNKLGDAENQRRKDIMQLNFDKNNIGKDHPDYVYDKVKTFGGGKEPVGWDSESEEGEKEDEGDDETPRVEEVEEDLSVPEQEEEEEEDFW